MAAAEPIKSLIRSKFSEDPERFHTIALQVAAYEARQGHKALVQDIRDIMIWSGRKKVPSRFPSLKIFNLKMFDAMISAMTPSKLFPVREEPVSNSFQDRSSIVLQQVIHAL